MCLVLEGHSNGLLLWHKWGFHYLNLISSDIYSNNWLLQKKRDYFPTDIEKQYFDNILKTWRTLSALTHPQPAQNNFPLVSDSSNYVFSATLHQISKSKLIPMDTLQRHKKKYSTFDRELLATFLVVILFWHIIESWNILLLTHHKPLCSAFHSVNVVEWWLGFRMLSDFVYGTYLGGYWTELLPFIIRVESFWYLFQAMQYTALTVKLLLW